MLNSNEGNKFWNRVDAVRDREKSLKQVIEEAGLNYEVVKVQRSLNRMPRAEEVCRLSTALKTPTEWLVLGVTSNPLDDLRVGHTSENDRIITILEHLKNAPELVIQSIEQSLGLEYKNVAQS
jgi:hypothetical protein